MSDTSQASETQAPALADLRDEAIRSRLTTRRYGHSLEVRAVTDSTNDDARRAAECQAQPGHVVVADRQRAGRGSRGRRWSSPPGSDLYLSIFDRLPLPLQAVSPLTLAVGLGTATTIARYHERAEDVRIKWPNDLWLRGLKCGGILVEALQSDAAATELVIGIGLNVNRSHWPSELQGLATALRSGPDAAPLPRERVLCDLLQDVEHWVDRFVQEGSESLSTALLPKLALRGERVRCGGHVGYLAGVAPTGALCLDSEHGRVEVIAGTLERV